MNSIQKTIAALVVTGLVPIGAAHAQEYRLGVLGAGPSSVGYQLAAGLAENTNTNSDELQLTAETSGGYIENVRLIGRDEAAFGLTGATQIVQGLRSEGPFVGEPAYDDIRGVAVAYHGTASWTARDGIESIEDLAGKTVSVGPPGSNIAYLGELILDAYGVKDDVEIVRLSYAEGSRALVDGTVDAFMGGPAPYPAVVEAGARADINILPLDAEHIEMIAKTTPVIQAVVPKEAYDWLDHDVTTIGYITYLIANKDVADGAVTALLDANLGDAGVKYLKANHRLWSMWETPEYIKKHNAFVAEGLKLHPAAAEYWKQHGVELPASIEP